MIPKDITSCEDRLKIVNTYLKNYNPIYGNRDLGVGFDLEKYSRSTLKLLGRFFIGFFAVIGAVVTLWILTTLFFLVTK